MPKTLEKPMDFQEVKEFLGMGSDFIYKELQKGRLTGRKLGNRWVVYPSDLQRYLERLPDNRKRIKRQA